MSVTAVVTGVERYCWVDETGHQQADRGETIVVSEAEFSRVDGALSVPAEPTGDEPDAEAPAEPAPAKKK